MKKVSSDYFLIRSASEPQSLSMCALSFLLCFVKDYSIEEKIGKNQMYWSWLKTAFSWAALWIYLNGWLRNWKFLLHRMQQKEFFFFKTCAMALWANVVEKKFVLLQLAPHNLQERLCRRGTFLFFINFCLAILSSRILAFFSGTRWIVGVWQGVEEGRREMREVNQESVHDLLLVQRLEKYYILKFLTLYGFWNWNTQCNEHESITWSYHNSARCW